MHLHITPSRLISDIQKEFNTEFPFLKIEFFNNKAFYLADFSANQIISPTRKIGDNQMAITDGEIEIDEQMKVMELEKKFKDQFSLAMKVFRKSGKLWLETTMTVNWTLQQQNDHGQEITMGKSNDRTSEDYDLTRDADH